jgi:hypothetical protein
VVGTHTGGRQILARFDQRLCAILRAKVNPRLILRRWQTM